MKDFEYNSIVAIISDYVRIAPARSSFEKRMWGNKQNKI